MSNRITQSDALFEVWHLLLKFRWRFVMPAFAVAALVLAVSMFLPRKYRAEAVFERRTDMVLAEIMKRGATRSFQDPRESLQNEIIGDPALDQTIDQIMPTASALGNADFNRAALRADLKRKTNISYDISSTDLDRIRVAYIGDEPALSRLIVNQLVRNYIDRTRQRIEERLTQSASFFEAEEARARQAIEELEAKKLAFEIENARLLPDNPNSAQGTIADLHVQLVAATERRDAATAMIQTLRKTLENTPQSTPTVVRGRNPELDRLEAQLRQFEAKYAEFVGVYKMKPKHPDVVAVTEQIDGVKKIIDATEKTIVVQTTDLPNARYGELEVALNKALTDLQSAERQHAVIQQQVAAAQQESSGVFGVRSEYGKIARAIEDSQRELNFWRENLRHVEMARTAESGDKGIQLSFIKECDVIHKPISPNLAQVLMAAAFLGMVAGGINVFYKYRTDETFSDAQQLSTAMSLPTFGAVSEIISQRSARLRRVRNLLLYPINGAIMATVLVILTGLLYMSLEKPHMISELKQDPLRFLIERVNGPTKPAEPAVIESARLGARLPDKPQEKY